MPKQSGDYKPSPWLRENLQSEDVRVPPAIVGALYQLQKDKGEVEYGGAIDFEIVHGKPAVERVLTYTGLVKAVPSETWKKVFLNPDIELTFHTHPGQDIAIPSEGDIIFFLTTDPSAMLIFASKEAFLMTKGENTPPASFAREHMYDTKREAATAARGTVPTKAAQTEMEKDLKQQLDINSVVYPADKPLDVTIKVVQEVARGGHRLQFFQ